MDFQSLLSNDIEKIPHSESLDEFLADYKCSRIIGEGGFGRVHKAVCVHDQCKVAIKSISNKKITSWHFDQRQNRHIPMEIALMCRCHAVPGIIKIIKYFEIKERKCWYIVMERFDKFIDLFDYITNQGHISEKMASNFMGQLLQIVTNCHKLGVCHRDIKDENIVVNLETMRVHLIDFGAGGFLHNGVYTEFDGTRVYSPPEWIQFKQYNVSQLEVWSLGILLFDMVCGNLPFDNDDSIINCIFSYRRSLSVNCQDLIQRCLQYDPTKRIKIHDILHHSWFNQLNLKFNLSSEPALSQFRAPSINVKYSTFNNTSPVNTTTITTSNNINSNNSRRVSLDSSPFTTPQSSGLEDFLSTESHSNSNPDNDGLRRIL